MAVHPGWVRDLPDRGGGLHSLQWPPSRAHLSALCQSHGHLQSLPTSHHIRRQRAAALRHRQHGQYRIRKIHDSLKLCSTTKDALCI